MIPKILAKYFDLLVDAPNGVSRLRRLVLDLAMRGKLVAQDFGDEPASALLNKIHAEKARRKIRTELTEEDLAKSSNGYFPIPENWKWIGATYPSAMVSDQGKKVQTKDIQESGAYPVVDQGKVFIRGYCNDLEKVIRVVEPIVLFGDHTRETKIINFDFVVGADGVKLLQPIGIDPSFYFLALRWLPLESRGYARHFKLLRAAKIPLPPLAEQRRIVTKVDQLMALCDELEERQRERKETRVRLCTTAHAALTTAPDPRQFARHWQRICDHFHLLYDTPQTLQSLCQTIRSLAVRGLLVPQDPGDEPADELLERLVRELSPEKRCRQAAPLPPISAESRQYELPKSWMWARFRDVAIIASNLVKPGDFMEFAHLAPDNIEKGNGVLLPCATIHEDKVISSNHRFYPGQIVYSKIRPNLSKVVVVDFDGLCSADMYPIDALIDANYLHCYMLSESFLMQAVKTDTRVAMPKINQAELNALAVPVPPLAEQRRIAAKMNQLMALCDELEKQLTHSDAESEKLMEAFVHHLLNGKTPTSSVAA